MRQSEIIHLYRRAGIYTYYIVVESAEAGPTPVPTSSLPIAVGLSVSPTTDGIGRLVDFTARLSRPDPNIAYRFVFADGSQTGWQKDPSATHSYSSPDIYQSYVNIGLRDYGSIREAGRSPRQPIRVFQTQTPSSLRVRLNASSTAVYVRRPITFIASVNSRESNVRYRFNFGDGSATFFLMITYPESRHVGPQVTQVESRTR